MLTNEHHTAMDSLWIDFWPASDIKPLAVIDFINTVFFIRQLEELHEEKERAAALSGKPVENAIYTTDKRPLRWSVFQNLDKQALHNLFNRKDDGVIAFAKSTAEYKEFSKFDAGAQGLVPVPYLLEKTVKFIGSLERVDSGTRTEMNNYLLTKIESKQETKELPLPPIKPAKKFKNRSELPIMTGRFLLFS